MQSSFGASNALNGRHCQAVDAADWSQASIHREMFNEFFISIVFRNHHGARTTTAFSASQLCATQTKFLTQITEKSELGIDIDIGYLGKPGKKNIYYVI
jgi:hypothetical protein